MGNGVLKECGDNADADHDANATLPPSLPRPLPGAVSANHEAVKNHLVSLIGRAAAQLTTSDAQSIAPKSAALLGRVLAAQPLTFQSKATNTVQIQSLLARVAELVGDTTPLILELGAGKALLARALYESFGRQLPVVALDSRRGGSKDLFYDPVDCGTGDAVYRRIVADVRDASWSSGVLGKRPVVAVTKHLCGGATDAALVGACDLQVDGICMAPCCHQKISFKEYCNLPYFEAIGINSDRQFRFLTTLIQMSRHRSIKDTEYKHHAIIRLLGSSEIRELGMQARRIVEEGRVRYLCERGFRTEVFRYVSEDVTPDNLVIIARKVPACVGAPSG